MIYGAAAPSAFQSTPANFTAGDHRLLQPLVHRPLADAFAAGHAQAAGFQSTPANFTAGDAA